METASKAIKTWTDEAGKEIPLKYISKSVKKCETFSERLLKAAEKQHKALADLKAMFSEICQEVYQDALAEYDMLEKTTGKPKKERKGNFTWFNFDRSIKIETSINDLIVFDDKLIKVCKEKLDEFLDAKLQTNEDFIRELIMDAFSTSRGQLDTGKVMSLLKYENKIKDFRYQTAMIILRDAIRRPDSRIYYRIWQKDETGKYKAIDLNFSSIEFHTNSPCLP